MAFGFYLVKGNVGLICMTISVFGELAGFVDVGLGADLPVPCCICLV